MGFGVSSESSMFGLFGIALMLVVGVLWLVIAASVALKGDTMDRSNRIAQLYGYTVCLVAVIVVLSSTASLLGAAIDRANPLQAEYSFGASLSSLEAYRATYQRERSMGGSEPAHWTRSPNLSYVADLRRLSLIVARRRHTGPRRHSSAVASCLPWRWRFSAGIGGGCAGSVPFRDA